MDGATSSFTRLLFGRRDRRASRTAMSVSTGAWDRERIAEQLVTHRERLIDELPRHTRGAIGLTRDQLEWVVDDATTFVATEYARPILDQEDLDRAFWSTAAHRVRRVHEGRGETVRAGWRRVDVADTVMPDPTAGPEALVLEQDERQAVLEFAAMLTTEEREIFAFKFGSAAKPQGYKLIARHLGLPIGTVRSAERAIEHKLERFTAILAAGALCRYRGVAVTAFADEEATEEQALAARVHLRHCSTCRVVYKRRLRATRGGDFQREVAQVLPFPAAAAIEERRSGIGGGPFQAVFDWITRSFASDGPNTVVQAATGGVGRGAGTVAALKVAAVCASGAAVAGGTYCTITGEWPLPRREPGSLPVEERPAAPQDRPVEPKAPRFAAPSPPLSGTARRSGRPKRRSRPSARQTRADTAAAERAVASSAPTSSSGNDFDFEQRAPTTSVPPTPAPETGGSEFLP